MYPTYHTRIVILNSKTANFHCEKHDVLKQYQLQQIQQLFKIRPPNVRAGIFIFSFPKAALSGYSIILNNGYNAKWFLSFEILTTVQKQNLCNAKQVLIQFCWLVNKCSKKDDNIEVRKWLLFSYDGTDISMIVEVLVHRLTSTAWIVTVNNISK